MGEKRITYTKTVERAKHQFYCDGCGKYLGESEEYDDGYYDKIGEYEVRFCIGKKWYRLRKCFCEECKTKQIEKIVNSLKDLGFEEGY